MPEHTNEAVIRAWVELLARWGADPADISRALELIDPDCDWIMMATGEKFHGHDAIRKMAGKSAAAISHNQEHKLEVTNLFVCGKGGCLEYVHGAILKLPGQSEAAPIDMPIGIVFEFRNGKIARAREYFEVLQMQGRDKVKPYMRAKQG
jgi:ketosteroid isomerase-like protein